MIITNTESSGANLAIDALSDTKAITLEIYCSDQVLRDEFDLLPPQHEKNWNNLVVLNDACGTLV
jgi:hypothetical protein